MARRTFLQRGWICSVTLPHLGCTPLQPSVTFLANAVSSSPSWADLDPRGNLNARNQARASGTGPPAPRLAETQENQPASERREARGLILILVHRGIVIQINPVVFEIPASHLSPFFCKDARDEHDSRGARSLSIAAAAHERRKPQ